MEVAKETAGQGQPHLCFLPPPENSYGRQCQNDWKGILSLCAVEWWRLSAGIRLWDSHIVAFNRAHCCIEPPICLAHVHFLCDFLCLSYQSKGHGLMQKAQPLQCTFIYFRLNTTKITILCGTSAFWVSQGKRGQRRSMSLCSILLLC